MTFSNAVSRFRTLSESIPIGGKIVKKSQVIDPDNEARIFKRGGIPRERYARSVPKAADKLKSIRQMVEK